MVFLLLLLLLLLVVLQLRSTSYIFIVVCQSRLVSPYRFAVFVFTRRQ